jgi:hypothetical protein
MRVIWLSAKSEKSSNTSVSIQLFSLSRESLTKLKLKAVRRGVWFSDLKHEERRLLDLTTNVVKRVRSFVLARIISQIVSKLNKAMESKILHLVSTKGAELAMKLSKIAQDWGHKTANTWAFDEGLMQFLVINNLSSLKG